MADKHALATGPVALGGRPTTRELGEFGVLHEWSQTAPGPLFVHQPDKERLVGRRLGRCRSRYENRADQHQQRHETYELREYARRTGRWVSANHI